jgi:hypothetical protein
MYLCVFCIILTMKSDCFPKQHHLIGADKGCQVFCMKCKLIFYVIFTLIYINLMLRLFDAGFALRILVFNARPVSVRSLTHEATTRQVYLPVILLSSVSVPFHHLVFVFNNTYQKDERASA